MYPGFWCGIGELMSRHDDLTALTYGEGIHMDSPAFRMIYDLSAGCQLISICGSLLSIISPSS